MYPEKKHLPCAYFSPPSRTLFRIPCSHPTPLSPILALTQPPISLNPRISTPSPQDHTNLLPPRLPKPLAGRHDLFPWLRGASGGDGRRQWGRCRKWKGGGADGRQDEMGSSKAKVRLGYSSAVKSIVSKRKKNTKDMMKVCKWENDVINKETQGNTKEKISKITKFTFQLSEIKNKKFRKRWRKNMTESDVERSLAVTQKDIMLQRFLKSWWNLFRVQFWSCLRLSFGRLWQSFNQDVKLSDVWRRRRKRKRRRRRKN